MTKKLLRLILVTVLLSGCASAAPLPPTRQPTNTPAGGIIPLTLAGIKERGVLVVGTAVTKPFEFRDPSTNEMVGFDVDTINYIGQKLGVRIEWIEMPFASLIPSLETGKVNAVIAAMYITDARRQVVDFADPYIDTGLVMVVRPELQGKVKTADDLNGLKVAVKIGATGDNLAQELVAKGIKLERKEYKDTLDSFLDLEVVLWPA